nr:MAG TPA: hypothetical protein [Caudoviricetes sp.]
MFDFFSRFIYNKYNAYYTISEKRLQIVIIAFQ